MKLVYDQGYWDQYYGDTYEKTYQYGFNLEGLLRQCWEPIFGSNPPQSFADIGAGPGQTLVEAERILGSNARIYGVEVQDIPAERVISKKIYFGDFLELSSRLDPVDLLYVSCSMYVPWEEQDVFLRSCFKLAKMATWFANVYLSDRDGIPEDRLRTTIYRSRPTFIEAVEGVGGWKWHPSTFDFFYRTSAR